MELLRWHIGATVTEVRSRAVAWITAAATEAIAQRGLFRVVLAGGETPRSVYESLCNIATDWHAWQIWFGDERCLPATDPRRNSRMAEETLLGHVAIPRGQIHAIRGELGADKAATDYCAALVGVPEFDLVLLGLGEDGHTASLFSGNEWGENLESPDVLAVHRAPTPPDERVSLSARRLANTRCALFLVSGSTKRKAIATWRAGGNLPAAAIRPTAGVDVLVEKICLETTH